RASTSGHRDGPGHDSGGDETALETCPALHVNVCSRYTSVLEQFQAGSATTRRNFVKITTLLATPLLMGCSFYSRFNGSEKGFTLHQLGGKMLSICSNRY